MTGEYRLRERLILLPSFRIEFDVKIPRSLSPGEDTYVIEFWHEGDYYVLLSVKPTTSDAIALAYNNVEVDDSSVKFISTSIGVSDYTRFTITVHNNDVSARSSASTGWLDSHPVSGMRDTTGEVYSLYLNGPAGGQATQFRNIVITGEFPLPPLRFSPFVDDSNGSPWCYVVFRHRYPSHRCAHSHSYRSSNCRPVHQDAFRGAHDRSHGLASGLSQWLHHHSDLLRR